MSLTSRVPRQFVVFIAGFFLVGLATSLVSAVQAANALTDTYIRLDRMKTGVGTSFRLVFKTSAVNGTEAKVKVVFTGFTVNGTQTVSTATCASESGATALPTSSSLSASGSGTTVTITNVANLAVSTRYCVDLTSATALTNPAAGPYTPTVTTTDSSDVVIDSRDVGLRIISDDQIVVTAVVPPRHLTLL